MGVMDWLIDRVASLFPGVLSGCRRVWAERVRRLDASVGDGGALPGERRLPTIGTTHRSSICRREGGLEVSFFWRRHLWDFRTPLVHRPLPYNKGRYTCTSVHPVYVLHHFVKNKVSRGLFACFVSRVGRVCHPFGQ